MKPFDKCLVAAAGAVLLGAAPLPAMAESSVSSSASDSVSTSVGSISDSIKKSSDSSSTTTKLTEGDYRVIDIAAMPERPGFLRLTLQAVAPPAGDDGVFFLHVPEPAVATSRVAQGDTVRARQRPYGFEFATRRSEAEPLRAFFLVLVDDWYRELQTKPVVL